MSPQGKKILWVVLGVVILVSLFWVTWRWPVKAQEGPGSSPVSSPADPGVSASADAVQAPAPVMKAADCSAYQSWVGQPVSEAAIQNTGRPYRILKPGSVMTMDFNPERVNVETDETGAVVKRVFCG